MNIKKFLYCAALFTSSTALANPFNPESSSFKILPDKGGWYILETGIDKLYNEGVNLYPDFTVGVYDAAISLDHEDFHSNIVDLGENKSSYEEWAQSEYLYFSDKRGQTSHGNMTTGIFSGAKIGNGEGARGVINAKTLFVSQFHEPLNSQSTCGSTSVDTKACLENLINYPTYSSGKILDRYSEGYRRPKIISISMALSPDFSYHVLDEREGYPDMSLSTYISDYWGKHLEATRVIRKFMEDNPDILFVIMAGNTGEDAIYSNGAIQYVNTIANPSSTDNQNPNNYVFDPLPNVLVVGAYHSNMELASYSAYGESVESYAPTDVMALSCADSQGSLYMKKAADYGEEYTGLIDSFVDNFPIRWLGHHIEDFLYDIPCTKESNPFSANGTSTATPIVAGIAGLMLSLDEELPPASLKAYITQESFFMGDKPLVNIWLAYMSYMDSIGMDTPAKRTNYNFQAFLKRANEKYNTGGFSQTVTLNNGKEVVMNNFGYPECSVGDGVSCGDGVTNSLDECKSIMTAFFGEDPSLLGLQTTYDGVQCGLGNDESSFIKYVGYPENFEKEPTVVTFDGAFDYSEAEGIYRLLNTWPNNGNIKLGIYLDSFENKSPAYIIGKNYVNNPYNQHLTGFDSTQQMVVDAYPYNFNRLTLNAIYLEGLGDVVIDVYEGGYYSGNTPLITSFTLFSDVKSEITIDIPNGAQQVKLAFRDPSTAGLIGISSAKMNPIASPQGVDPMCEFEPWMPECEAAILPSPDEVTSFTIPFGIYSDNTNTSVPLTIHHQGIKISNDGMIFDLTTRGKNVTTQGHYQLGNDAFGVRTIYLYGQSEKGTTVSFNPTNELTLNGYGFPSEDRCYYTDNFGERLLSTLTETDIEGLIPHHNKLVLKKQNGGYFNSIRFTCPSQTSVGSAYNTKIASITIK